MKLKAKFILPALALILAGMSVTTWVTYRRSTDSLSAMTVEKAQTSLTALLSMVELWVNGAQNEVVTLSKTDAVIQALAQGQEAPKTGERAKALLDDVNSRQPNFDSLLLLSPQGAVIGGTNQRLMGTDLSKREYFQKAMHGQNYISSPVFAADTGQAVFVIASPVMREGKTVGVLAAGVKISQFADQFVKPLDTAAGYPFMTASDGLMLAHPDSKLIGKFNLFKETDYGKQIVGQSSGHLEAVSLGTEKLILFEKSKLTGWVIAMAVDKAKAFADARNLGLFILALSAGQAAVLVCGIWIILSVSVLRPVGALVDAATAIADGRLDTALDAARGDEIGVLQQAMAKMVANLKAKIGEAEDKGNLAEDESQKARAAMAEAEQAREQAEHARQEGMLQAAGRLESVVEAVSTALEEISAQIEQSSRGSEEQARHIGETATSMEEMNATVLEVAKNASQAAATADQARHKANEGSEIVARVIRSVSELEASALGLKDDMTRLGQQAEGIGRIMNVISDIADQTNLLALNAAIEAARAGEAGRGFAVVADEVRKLAEKTMSATKEVGDAIQGIQQGTRKNIGNVEGAVHRINESAVLAGQSGETLTAIVGLVDQTTDQVRSIATASEQQSSASEEINRSIEDVNRISLESADAMRQSAQAVAELANQSHVLAALIEEMQAEGSGTPYLAASDKRLSLVGGRKA